MTGSIRILTTADEAEWRAALPASVSVFGSVEYARISQVHSGHPARLATLTTRDSIIAYPFFLRPLAGLPFSHRVPGACYDTLTPEYTGPLARRMIHPASMSEPGAVTAVDECRFAGQFALYCQQQGIVAEFAHLHPWARPLPGPGQSSIHAPEGILDLACVQKNREIVYVDVQLPEEQLWQSSFNRACRKNIRRAAQENVRVYPAECEQDIHEFHRIYTQTMDRVSARDRYYYPPESFLAFWEQLPDHARFALAECDGKIAAATLYLHDDTDVYAYLGGADHACQSARPTNAIVYETIRWAQAQGKKRLVLGGGYRPDDGIFHFKASFSPLRAQFHIYKRIHLAGQYAALCDAWSAYYGREIDPGGYFPPYRSIPATVENNT